MKQKSKPNPLIEDELFEDEELVWWGQPIAHYLMRNISLPQMGMAIVMIIFASFFYLQTQEMFSESSFSFGRRSSFPSFLPLLFTIVPAVMVLGALWTLSTPIQQWIKGQRTYYALTNKRAIIIEQLFSKKVQSFYDEQIEKMQVTTYAGGVGDIIFATATVQRQITSSRRNRGMSITFEDGGMRVGSNPRTRTVTYQVQQGFRAIQDVRVVEDFIAQIFFSDDNIEQPAKKKTSKPMPQPLPRQQAFPTMMSEQDKLDEKVFDSINLEELNKRFDNFSEHYPDKASVLLEYGNAQFREKNYREAIEEYRRSIKLKKDNPVAYNKRAEAYIELMEFDSVIADCTAAIKYDPEYAQAYNNRGFVHIFYKDYDSALKDLNQCLKLNPNHEMAHYNKGSAYTHLKDHKNAQKCYDEVIRINPKNSFAYSNRGITHYYLGDTSAAIADWDNAIELSLTLPESVAKIHADLKAKQ